MPANMDNNTFILPADIDLLIELEDLRAFEDLPPLQLAKRRLRGCAPACPALPRLQRPGSRSSVTRRPARRRTRSPN